MAQVQSLLRHRGEETREQLEAARRVLERVVRGRCFGLLASAREDLVQSAMVRILERSRTEDFGTRGASYFWKVAQSVVVDELRRLGRERRLAEDVPKERQSWRDPVDGIQLRRCVERLEERRRLAVTLHLSGLRIPEVARAGNWTEKTAENLIYRGLQDLRTFLAEN
jgi:RNA polymerase sigma factor (sigma-70 family)